MQADWLEKFYADDTYLDFGKAMRGGTTHRKSIR